MKKEKLKILYEDKYLIIVYKKAGLLMVGTDKEKEKTLFHEVRDYLKQKNKNNKVFIVHRLDKDTEGLVILAKDLKTKNIMQSNWDKVIRKYICLVHGFVKDKKKSLINYLKESKTYEVYVTCNDKLGKKAITNYEVIKQNKGYSLLNIEIKTGRKHQIRVQLANISHPIVGDKKYSKKKDGMRNLCLCANYVKFKHPINQKEIEVQVDYPKKYDNLI